MEPFYLNTEPLTFTESLLTFYCFGLGRSIAKDVTVLHQGSVLAEGTMAEVQSNRKVVEVYLGEEAC